MELIRLLLRSINMIMKQSYFLTDVCALPDIIKRVIVRNNGSIRYYVTDQDELFRFMLNTFRNPHPEPLFVWEDEFQRTTIEYGCAFMTTYRHSTFRQYNTTYLGVLIQKFLEFMNIKKAIGWLRVNDLVSHDQYVNRRFDYQLPFGYRDLYFILVNKLDFIALHPIVRTLMVSAREINEDIPLYTQLTNITSFGNITTEHPKYRQLMKYARQYFRRTDRKPLHPMAVDFELILHHLTHPIKYQITICGGSLDLELRKHYRDLTPWYRFARQLTEIYDILVSGTLSDIIDVFPGSPGYCDDCDIPFYRNYHELGEKHICDICFWYMATKSWDGTHDGRLLCVLDTPEFPAWLLRTFGRIRLFTLNGNIETIIAGLPVNEKVKQIYHVLAKAPLGKYKRYYLFKEQRLLLFSDKLAKLYSALYGPRGAIRKELADTPNVNEFILSLKLVKFAVI